MDRSKLDLLRSCRFIAEQGDTVNNQTLQELVDYVDELEERVVMEQQQVSYIGRVAPGARLAATRATVSTPTGVHDALVFTPVKMVVV